MGDSGAFAITTRVEAEQVTVEIAGEIDELRVDELATAFARAIEDHPVLVVVDLAGVTFFGSAGIRCLLQANNAAREARIGFRVARPSEVVQRVVQLTGIGTVLHVDA